MAYPKEAQQKGGHSQVLNLYQCPKCNSIGSGNKMVHHIEICDGTGFKNYWSRKKSAEWIRRLSNLF